MKLAKIMVLILGLAMLFSLLFLASCDDDDDDSGEGDDDVTDDDSDDDTGGDDDEVDDDADDDVTDDDTSVEYELEWQSQVVAENYTETRYHSLAYLSDGTPVIAFYSKPANNLVFATPAAGGKGWILTVVDNDADVGSYASIDVDSNDRIGIAYYDTANKDLKLAMKEADGDWEIQVLDDNRVGEYATIRFDPNDNAKVFAAREGGSWYIAYYNEGEGFYKRELFNPLDINYGFAADLDSTGRAGFGWYEWYIEEPYKNGEKQAELDILHAASFDMIEMEQHSVIWAGEGIRKTFSAFAWDKNDKPMAFFATTSLLIVRVCQVSGTFWTISDLPDEDAIIEGPFHARRGGDGNIYLCYVNALSHMPRLATYENNTWTFQDLPAEGQTAQFVELNVAPDNLPAVIYYDSAGGNLMYAKLENVPVE